MDILIDTGVLLRLVIRTDPAHQETRSAGRLLKARGDNLVALTQNAAEFWNVCTRPASVGGYGLSIQETQGKLRGLERLVEFRADSLAAFQEWKRLVVAHRVAGVKVHDTRLVVAMQAQGITQIVTYNKQEGLQTLSEHHGVTARRGALSGCLSQLVTSFLHLA